MSKRDVYPSPGRIEPTGALRANDTKALSQRQWAKELVWLQGGRKTAFSRGKKSHLSSLPT